MLSKDMHNKVKEELSKDEVLQAKYRTLNSLEELGPLLKKHKPSEELANKVMASIDKPETVSSKFFNRNRLISLALMAILFITASYYLAANLMPSFSGFVPADPITVQERTLDLTPALDILGNDMLFKIVLYVNGIICLFLFERAILRPLFMKRKETNHGQFAL